MILLHHIPYLHIRAFSEYGPLPHLKSSNDCQWYDPIFKIINSCGFLLHSQKTRNYTSLSNAVCSAGPGF